MISFIKLYNKNEKDIFFYINKKIRPRMKEIKDNNFKQKYIKYKKKYLDLKNNYKKFTINFKSIY